MAAAVLESVSIPHASAFHKPAAAAAAVSPRMAMESSISSSPSRHRMGLLPEFKGLKVAKRAAARSVAVVGGGRVVHRRGVVCEAQDTAVGVPDVTTATWQPTVVECDTPVLVEFWAQWCGPCRMLLPVVDELSKEYTGKMKFLKLNTDDCPDIATKYGVRSVPTTVIFKNGEKQDAIIGAVTKPILTACIEKFL